MLVPAIVLGKAIYKQNNPKPSPESVAPKLSNLMPSELTEDEKAVLAPPSPDASAEERDKHTSLATKLSKESDNLDITNCSSNPLVLRIKNNKNLKVKNSDDVPHMLILDDSHKYQIAKNSTTDLKVDFGHGIGLYGYICEGVGLTGFILVTP